MSRSSSSYTLFQFFMIKWIAPLLLFPAFANATNYYFSNSGDDNNKGTSAAAAWQSIAKLNAAFAAIRAGDTIFFKRGDVFYGSIKITQSGAPGKPIVFTAYGQGANPVISGFTLISGWKKKEGGVWEAPAASIKENLNMVTLNGIPQRIARYPNADAPDGGYLRYENFSGNTSITGNQSKDSINLAGAEIVIRKNHWTAERCKVTSHEGNMIRYRQGYKGINTAEVSPTLFNGIKGHGYFFQNDPRLLDELGEWFFDTLRNTLQLFFGKQNPAAYLVKASTVDTLVNAGNRSFITMSRLSFEGANISGFFSRNGSDITIRYCNFTSIGKKAIQVWNSPDVLIDHVNTNYILSNAIQVRNKGKQNVTISNCLIKNTGTIIGMGSFFDGRDYKAIAVLGNNILIENNRIDTVGFCGIEFQGNDIMVRNNVVNYFCYLLDDGGGIYTWVVVIKGNTETFTNRVVQDNIVLNGIGATEGCTRAGLAEGIYLDGEAMNTAVLNNTVAFVADKAIGNNNPVNVTIRGNTVFNAKCGWSGTRLYDWENIRQLTVKDNIFYSTNDKQIQFDFYHSGLDLPRPAGIWEAIRSMGDIDSNYYNTVNPVGFNYSYAPFSGKPNLFPSPLSFENWKALSGQDQHSKRPEKLIPLYVLKNIKGPNLVRNGSFAKDINTVEVFGSNTIGQWDNSGKLTGNGSVKIEFSKPETSHYGVIHSSVGKLLAGKNYIFRFNTRGTTEYGIVRAGLRKTLSPYNDLMPPQTQVFGTDVQQHEYMFSVNHTDTASFVIAIEKNSGTVYIDDIELYEADTTPVDINDQVRFEYNATNSTITIPLNKKYVGVDGSMYKSSLILPPFSSKILISTDMKE